MTSIFLCRWKRAFDGEGGLLELARSYKRFGLHLLPNGDLTYKEWAPAAKGLSIVSCHSRNHDYSLVTSTTGTGINTNAKRINSVYGLLYLKLNLMEHLF